MSKNSYESSSGAIEKLEEKRCHWEEVFDSENACAYYLVYDIDSNYKLNIAYVLIDKKTGRAVVDNYRKHETAGLVIDQLIRQFIEGKK